MRVHKVTAEKIHEFSHSCLLVSAVGAFVHSWRSRVAGTEGALQRLLVIERIEESGFYHITRYVECG